MRILRGFFYFIILVAIGIGVLFVGARFNDGPLAIIPGGPLKSGAMVSEAVDDWSFASDIQEIAMQLTYQNTSRTTWIVVYENKAYIPVSMSFPPGKSWHYAADEDGRALLRIAGKRYPVSLSRVMDEELAEQIDVNTAQKYPNLPTGDGDDGPGRWYFNVESR